MFYPSCYILQTPGLCHEGIFKLVNMRVFRYCAPIWHVSPYFYTRNLAFVSREMLPCSFHIICTLVLSFMTITTVRCMILNRLPMEKCLLTLKITIEEVGPFDRKACGGHKSRSPSRQYQNQASVKRWSNGESCVESIMCGWFL